VRPEKKYIVDDLSNKIKDADSFFITSYLGLSAENMNELRSECRKQSCQYLIVKNRILKIALQKAGIAVDDQIDSALKESTAVAFTKEDAVAVAKLLIKYGKSNGLPKIKGGFVDGSWFEENRIVEFSKLPSREVLLAQLMGAFKGPLNGMLGVLNGPIRSFVRGLNAVAEKKGKE
jgi:large subunit ribosomal protein L10